MATCVRSNRAALTGLLLVGAASLGLGACAQGGGDATGLLAQQSNPTRSANSSPQSELQRAIEYWGGEFQKKPHDPKVALNFAKNLKAAGLDANAMQVLSQAHSLHSGDREIASELGRLALATDKVAMADSLLAFADDPTKPDWRVISARGTVHAKRGEYPKAITYYERANSLAPNEASVLNNLALAYAANGESQRAEATLRAAKADNPAEAGKIRQNLALVVGLQGRYGEAETLASKDLPPEQAAANARFVRHLVRVPEQSAPVVKAVASSNTSPSITSASAPTGKPSKAMLAAQKLADAHTAK